MSTFQDNRIVNIDRLRFFAAFGIVWFHTSGTPGRVIGYSGLPIFIIIFCALSSLKPKPEHILPFAQKKALRLLKPWLFWSLVYLSFKLIKRDIFDMTLADGFKVNMIFTGTTVHLWYLPFAFIAGLIVNLCQHLTMRISVVAAICSTFLIGILLLVCSSIMLSLTRLPVPMPQWIFGIPAVPIGIAIGRVFGMERGMTQKLIYISIFMLTAGTCLILHFCGFEALVIQYPIATALVCAVLIWRGKWDPLTPNLAALSYGIYLIHPVFLAIPRSLGINLANSSLTALIVFCLSSVSIFLLQKTYFKQFI